MRTHTPPPVFFQVSAQLLALLLIAFVVQFRSDLTEPGPSRSQGHRIYNALFETFAVLAIVAGELAALTALAAGPTRLKLEVVSLSLAIALSVVTFMASRIVIASLLPHEVVGRSGGWARAALLLLAGLAGASVYLVLWIGIP